jgi:uncharacterized membrane protein/mono/diheme cytochrome c family protein
MSIFLQQDSADLALFFGRFHPLIVHMPIGILFLGIVLFFASRSRRFPGLAPALDITLLLSAVFSVLAVVSGFMLSSSGGYDAVALDRHKIAGIALAALCVLIFLLNRFALKRVKGTVLALLAVFTGFVLIVTGHLGGNLTHGSAYLFQHAPQLVKNIAGYEPAQYFVKRELTVLDSAKLFEDVVMQIFDARCISCHNPEKKKGGLLLTSHQAISEGGEGGPILDVDDPAGSELIRRITLPQADEKAMPPEGKEPLTERQVQLLELWISQGAAHGAVLAEATLSDEDKKLVALELGLSSDATATDQALAAIQAPDVSDELLEELRSEGFQVRRLAQESPLLEVDFSLTQGALSEAQFKSLEKITPNIVWLNLGRSSISNTQLAAIAGLENVVRLRLDQTDIGDEGLAHLVALRKLEYLNLYGTNITDASLDIIKAMPSLKRLFIWQTGLSAEAIETLRAERPDLTIETGISSAALKKTALRQHI